MHPRLGLCIQAWRKVETKGAEVDAGIANDVFDSSQQKGLTGIGFHDEKQIGL